VARSRAAWPSRAPPTLPLLIWTSSSCLVWCAWDACYPSAHRSTHRGSRDRRPTLLGGPRPSAQETHIRDRCPAPCSVDGGSGCGNTRAAGRPRRRPTARRKESHAKGSCCGSSGNPRRRADGWHCNLGRGGPASKLRALRQRRRYQSERGGPRSGELERAHAFRRGERRCQEPGEQPLDRGGGLRSVDPASLSPG